VSTIALFNPVTAPLGIVGLIGSGVSSLATLAGDEIANAVNNGNIGA